MNRSLASGDGWIAIHLARRLRARVATGRAADLRRRCWIVARVAVLVGFLNRVERGWLGGSEAAARQGEGRRSASSLLLSFHGSFRGEVCGSEQVSNSLERWRMIVETDKH